MIFVAFPFPTPSNVRSVSFVTVKTSDISQICPLSTNCEIIASPYPLISSPLLDTKYINCRFLRSVQFLLSHTHLVSLLSNRLPQKGQFCGNKNFFPLSFAGVIPTTCGMISPALETEIVSCSCISNRLIKFSL